jgi:hypothetical protein
MRTNDINDYMRPSRVLDGMPNIEKEGFRRLIILEAAQYFQIANEATIRGWWIKREKIFGNRSIFSTYPPKWPALEKTLVEHFTAARTENKIVTVHWFRRMAQQIWQRLYPRLVDVFVFFKWLVLEVSTPPLYYASEDHQNGHKTTRRGCESAELLHLIHSEE